MHSNLRGQLCRWEVHVHAEAFIHLLPVGIFGTQTLDIASWRHTTSYEWFQSRVTTVAPGGCVDARVKLPAGSENGNHYLNPLSRHAIRARTHGDVRRDGAADAQKQR